MTLWCIVILSASSSVAVEAEMHRKVWIKPQKFWEGESFVHHSTIPLWVDFSRKFSINLCLYATDHKDKTVLNQMKQFSHTDETNFFFFIVLSIKKQTWTSLQGSVNVFFFLQVHLANWKISYLYRPGCESSWVRCVPAGEDTLAPDTFAWCFWFSAFQVRHDPVWPQMARKTPFLKKHLNCYRASGQVSTEIGIR